jgi:hypothetical protein
MRSDAEHKIGMLRTAAAETRQDKSKDAIGDHAAWRKEAAAAGFPERPVLHQQPILPELSPERRHAVGYEELRQSVAKLFHKTAIVLGDELNALAAGSLIKAGISDRPSHDIAGVISQLFKHGFTQDGRQTSLLTDSISRKGKQRTIVSTDRHFVTETDLVAIAQKLAADRTAALSPTAIDRAAAAYLHRHPEIDPAGHWKLQLEWAHTLGAGGRLSIGIGGAGVGKSTVVSMLTEAWQAEGRTVFGTILSHTQVADMAAIPAENRTAIDPFLRGAARGRYALDTSSVVVVDEVGLLGNRQMRELLQLGEKTGATICMIGDTAQCRSPEAGDPIALIERALPDAIPALVKSIRQQTAHELAVAQMFRDDPAAGLRMKIEDGTARLISGGSEATIAAAVQLRRELLSQGGDLAVMAPSNEAAAIISRAIRADRQQHGEIGPDQITLRAIDKTGHHTMPLGVGDEVRLYRRIHDDSRRVLANNGETVTITALDQAGINVRNLKTGVEGTVPWRKLHDSSKQVWLSYAGCATVDITQSRTVSKGLLVLPNGSAGFPANKINVAMTRHRYAAYLLVDEASVRRGIARRALVGEPLDIRQADVWRQVGKDFSRRQVKENATDTFAAQAKAQSPAAPTREHGTRMAYARDRVREVAHATREQIRHVVQRLVHRQPERHEHPVPRHHEHRHERNDRRDFGLSR